MEQSLIEYPHKAGFSLSPQTVMMLAPPSVVAEKVVASEAVICTSKLPLRGKNKVQHKSVLHLFVSLI